ncbi:MAG: energy-coupled thiamine transporter ThiT [Candidatus Izemoplasmatales bacterium]|jgi:thiamine transporter|nr:energy-coupled thiamine transporter ThiT [Candidatus Izemoplasmatales bacterium]
MNKNVKVVAEIAILLGVAVVLDIVFGILSQGIFPWGGSISPAMLPIFIIAYRRGVKNGLLAGFMFAVIQMMMTGMISSGVIAAIPESPYVGPGWLKLILVYLLDYLIPFTLLGLAGIFKGAINNLKPFVLGMILAAFIRYLSHGISGVLIWGSYTSWFNETYGTNVSPFIYSFVVYNLPYMAASLLICILVGIIIFKRGLLKTNI